MSSSGIPVNIYWTLHDRIRGNFLPAPGWTVTKVTPRREVWGKSKHGAARVVHRVRFQVTATKTSGGHRGSNGEWIRDSLTFTVWRCGVKATDWRGIEIKPDPITSRRPLKERCHGCERPDKD